MPKKQELTVEGRAIPVTNLDKVLYPAAHFTKRQVIDYYIRAAQFILPHLEGRPVTLKRFPDGVRGDFFYEKDAPRFTPDWVRRVPVARRDRSQKDINYIVIDDLPTLVWLANLANLEVHPFLHRGIHLDRPTSVVFDFDPGEGADILDCAHVAFLVRDLLGELGLKTFAKVSGSKGLQLYVPLNIPTARYAVTQPFAKAVAELMEQRHPDLVVSKMTKANRAGKVFIDWSQNSDFKTTVGVYSLRAKSSRPLVSMPVKWEELEAAVEANDRDRLFFTPDAAIDRLRKIGDLFQPVLSLRQKLPKPFVNQVAKLGNAAGVAKKASEPASLAEYRRKRDFKKTKEPAPEPVRASRQGSARRFVIQKHAASHLHYDFRLEMHDTLKSWAVPKGPPYKRGEKRLAMPTEDHPISYLDFEGTIPQGQYGGGTVMVWEIGSYELMEGNYYKGYLHFFLSGRKLKGEWQLIRGRVPKGKREVWFLGKVASSMRPVSKKKDDESAISGRSMEEIRTADRPESAKPRKSRRRAA
jgi:bifunctional non-homologous end joining protein LigD